MAVVRMPLEKNGIVSIAIYCSCFVITLGASFLISWVTQWLESLGFDWLTVLNRATNERSLASFGIIALVGTTMIVCLHLASKLSRISIIVATSSVMFFVFLFRAFKCVLAKQEFAAQVIDFGSGVPVEGCAYHISLSALMLATRLGVFILCFILITDIWNAVAKYRFSSFMLR